MGNADRLADAPGVVDILTGAAEPALCTAAPSS